MRGETDPDALLRSLDPVLNDGVYAYSRLPHGASMPDIGAIATFREAEGMTLIAPESSVLRAGLPVLFRCAWITLNVYSDLGSVGLTATVARALAESGISCNVVAAANHDHLFVPVARAGDAVAALEALQQSLPGAK